MSIIDKIKQIFSIPNNQHKKEKKEPAKRKQTHLEHIFSEEKASKTDWENHIKEFHEREAKRKEAKKKQEQECLRHLGYEGVDLEKMKAEGYRKNFKDGKYIHNPSMPIGSIDNPREVGIKGCCTSLFFAAELGGWVLTDGLGNGILR